MNNFETIVKSQTYPAIIIANAGTGKTELIARKIEHLVLNKDVDLDKIVFITFTNKATHEAIERITNKVHNSWFEGKLNVRKQLNKLSNSKISTIHSFCDELLREYGVEIGLSPTFNISSLSLEKDALINAILEENFDQEVFNVLPMYKIGKILKKLEESASDKGLDFVLKEYKEESYWDKLRNYFYKIYPIYKKRLEDLKLEQNTITTNDLISYTVKLLDIPQVKKVIKQEVEYLFLDEAQDINFDQSRLMIKLIEIGIKVFVVGDEKQSIYSFRGSEINAFRELKSYIIENNGVEYTLTENYRTDKNILLRLNTLFSKQFKYKKKPLSFNYIPFDVKGKVKNTENIAIEYNKSIAEIVSEVISQGYKFNDIAILCRTNKEVLNVNRVLTNANFATELYLKKNLYKSKAVLDLYKLLCCVNNGELQKQELFYTDYYVAARNNKFSDNAFYALIDKGLMTFKNFGIINFLSLIIENTKIVCYYKNNNDEQAIVNLQRILEIIRDLQNDGMTDMEIIKFLKVMIVTGQEENQPQIEKENAITVSTIHTFKGLDKRVIIVNEIDNNLNKHHFADFHYLGDLGFNQNNLVINDELPEDGLFVKAKQENLIRNLEEEIRILYVALTRAKEKIILHSKKTLDKVKYQISKNKEYVSYLKWIFSL